jgi:inner membrane protein
MAVAANTHARPLDSLILAGLAGAAALLPDIDHPRSTIRREMGLLGRVGLFWLSHRGLTHTWLLLLVLGAAALLLLPAPVALAAIAGYSSHIVMDMMTVSGLPVFWPVTDGKFYVLPYPLRFRTGRWAESLLDVALVALVVWLVAPIVK